MNNNNNNNNNSVPTASMSDLELYNLMYERGTDSALSKPEKLEALAATIAATYARKNADYGDSFGKSVQRYGLISALTRMSDKWNRLETLILNKVNGGTGPMVKDEALADTLMDLATYCLMTVMELEE